MCRPRCLVVVQGVLLGVTAASLGCANCNDQMGEQRATDAGEPARCAEPDANRGSNGCATIYNALEGDQCGHDASKDMVREWYADNVSPDTVPPTAINVRVLWDGAYAIDEQRSAGAAMRFRSREEVIEWLKTYEDSELRGGIVVHFTTRSDVPLLASLRLFAVAKGVSLFSWQHVSGSLGPLVREEIPLGERK